MERLTPDPFADSMVHQECSQPAHKFATNHN